MRLLPLLFLTACRPDADALSDDTGQPVPGAPDRARLLGHVETLSSAEYAGREPGTAGGDLAAAYVETHYQGLGLQGAGDDGGFRQLFPLQRFVVQAPPALALAGQELAADDFQLFTWSGSGEVEAEVVLVGYGLTVPPFDPADYPGCPLDPGGYDDYQGLDLGGKVALVARHGPNDDQAINDHCPVNEAGLADGDLFTFGYKAANAAQHGAGAMLLFTDYAHAQAPAEAGTLGEGYFQPDLPAFFVARDAVEQPFPELHGWMDAVDAGAALPQETGLLAAVSAETGVEAVEVPNILAEIPGSDRGDEVIVVGAHFDHLGTGPDGEIFYGADDNASGTAVLLELAELFGTWGATPARTIVFASFNAEELGLIGSMHYIIDPPHPIPDTVAMLNLDMVGGGDELGVLDFGGIDEGSEWLYDLLVTQQDDDFPVTPLSSDPNSDHAFFQLAGVPVAFLFTVGAHAPYHTPADTFDTISGYELEQTARLAWDTLRVLAMGRDEPAAARVLPPPAEGLPRPPARQPTTR